MGLGSDGYFGPHPFYLPGHTHTHATPDLANYANENDKYGSVPTPHQHCRELEAKLVEVYGGGDEAKKQGLADHMAELTDVKAERAHLEAEVAHLHDVAGEQEEKLASSASELQVGLELTPTLTSITTSPYKGSGLVYRVMCRPYQAQTSIIVGSDT